MVPPSGSSRATPLCVWVVLLGAILLVPHLRPAAIFLLPGLLIHSRRRIKSKDGLFALAETIASSISFWVVTVWGASWIGLHLSTFFWVVCPVSATLWLLLVARKRDLPVIFPTNPMQTTAIVLALILTMMPFFLTVAPPGADMSMHGYITRMVNDAGGVPDTYEPYLPISEFGAFSIGFQTLAALTTTISGGILQLHRAVLFIDCLVYFLLFLFLMGALRRRFSGWTSLACASLALFVTRSPQHFFVWGGAPTVLSIGLIACALPALMNLRNAKSADVGLSAFWLAAGFLCHPLPTIILGTIYLPYAAYLVAVSIREGGFSQLMRRYAAIVAIGLACTSFFMARFQGRMSENETEWIQVWDSVVQERWHGTLLNAPITLTRHLAHYSLGFLTIPLGFAMLLAVFSRHREDRANLYFVLAIAGIVINARYQALPKSVYLFPDRADAMLPLFAAPLIGSLLVKAKRMIGGILDERRIRLLTLLGLLAVGCASVAGSYAYYMRPGLAEAPVTQDDLRAFEWINNNADPDAHFANNYSDAGLWIPTMARRTVTVPHVNIINWSETKLALASRPAQFIYIGARSVYPFPFEWTQAGVEALRPKPRLAFQSGEARIYELDPTLARAISTNFDRLVVAKGKVLGEIDLLRPTQAETLTTPRIVLEWDPSGCDLFNVQLSLSPNFDNPLPIYNSYPAVRVTSGAYDITPLGPLMPPNTPVYWRVRGLPAARSDLFESPIRYFLRE